MSPARSPLTERCQAAGTVGARAVVIPVHDEAGTIREVLDQVDRYFDGEVIVVDDGSTDGTGAVLGARDGITVLRFAENLGYGAALAAGFVLAREMGIEQLVTMDCDGQHEPAMIPTFFAELDAGGDIVSGSRYLPTSERADVVPQDRRAINERITALVNERTGWQLTDAFCGFKGYRLAALDGLDFHEWGYAFPLEVWAKANKAGLDVREVAVPRIYLNVDRSFGEELDDPESRESYYRNVWATYAGGEDG